MAKGSGSTRAGSPGARGRYVTYTDEDTGESTRVYIPAESPERRALTASFEKYESKTEKQISSLEKQRDDISIRSTSLLDDILDLGERRRELLSDMEDELGRNETARRRDWYGSQLNKIDSSIKKKRAQVETANARYNTINDRISRLSEELDKRRKEYRDKLRTL